MARSCRERRLNPSPDRPAEPVEDFLGLRPYDKIVGVQTLGNIWSLHRPGQTLRCALTTHPLAWELRALVGDELMPSTVCKTQEAILDTAAAWKAEARQKKWQE